MDGLREGMVLREINGVPLAAVKKRGARTHLLTGIDGEPHPAKQVRHAPCPPPAACQLLPVIFRLSVTQRVSKFGVRQ